MFSPASPTLLRSQAEDRRWVAKLRIVAWEQQGTEICRYKFRMFRRASQWSICWFLWCSFVLMLSASFLEQFSVALFWFAAALWPRQPNVSCTILSGRTRGGSKSLGVNWPLGFLIEYPRMIPDIPSQINCGWQGRMMSREMFVSSTAGRMGQALARAKVVAKACGKSLR